jgi:purine-binding chemotaxis protein CheW
MMTNPTHTEPAVHAAPATSPLAGDEEVSDIRQFVTFISGNEVFAVDMTPVQEIIRMPDVVRVPLSPRTLDGLANLRGKVLPMVSLRRVFGFDEKPHDDATRALVIDLGQPLGFVVDRVASVVGVEPSKLESTGSLKGTVNAELLSGIMKDVGGHPMIMVLDFAKLIAKEFSEIKALARTSTARAVSSTADVEDEVASDELRLVSFDVDEQEYAIAIEDVQEIVQVSKDIVRVPHAESYVVGLMTLRNRLLPLVSLRRMFSLEPLLSDEHSRIVVVALGAVSVGIVVDRVNEVLRVAKTDVDAMPNILAREGSMSEISQICRLDRGKRLVAIIAANRLFHHAAIKEALTTVTTKHAADDLEQVTEVDVDDEQVVVFRLGKEEFGAPIDTVQEIVRVPEQLTHVPKAPPFVEGVINLRGAVLPVVDLRRRLDMPPTERTDRQRVMVFLIGGIRTGFIVDSVAEVLRIPKSAIEPTPRLSSDQGKLLARMANLGAQKRLVQLIAPSYLLEGTDLATLDPR